MVVVVVVVMVVVVMVMVMVVIMVVVVMMVVVMMMVVMAAPISRGRTRSLPSPGGTCSLSCLHSPSMDSAPACP